MCAKGLYKSTGYWQTQAAKDDWNFLAAYSITQGLAREVEKLTPPDNWGWRRIDKRIVKLKDALSMANRDIPKLPSQETK